MQRHRHSCWGPFNCCPYGHGFMSVEEEVEMLEKAKEHLESHLANINARLEKLKE